MKLMVRETTAWYHDEIVTNNNEERKKTTKHGDLWRVGHGFWAPPRIPNLGAGTVPKNAFFQHVNTRDCQRWYHEPSNGHFSGPLLQSNALNQSFHVILESVRHFSAIFWTPIFFGTSTTWTNHRGVPPLCLWSYAPPRQAEKGMSPIQKVMTSYSPQV